MNGKPKTYEFKLKQSIYRALITAYIYPDERTRRLLEYYLPKLAEVNSFARVFDQIVRMYHGGLPLESLKAELRKYFSSGYTQEDEDMILLLEEKGLLSKPNDSEINWFITEVDTFLKTIELKRFTLEVMSYVGRMDSLKVSELNSLMTEMTKTYQKLSSFDYSTEATIDIKEIDGFDRPYMRKESPENIIPTGIIDDILNGGMRKGWFGIVSAGTGIGKSTFLVNLAANAIRYKKNVLYLSLEMSPEDILLRLDACMTGRPVEHIKALYQYTYAMRDPIAPRPVEADKRRFIEELLNIYYDMDIIKQIPNPTKETYEKYSKVGNLTIHYRPAKSITAYQLPLILDEFKLKGKVFDCVIVDFADYFGSPSPHYSYWEAVAESFQVLPGVAKQFNIVLWTATEIGKKEMFSESLSLSDVYGLSTKLFGADLIIGLSNVKDLVRQNSVDGSRPQLNLSVMKYRHGPLPDRPVPIRIDDNLRVVRIAQNRMD